jgi:uncharacterized protein (TIGR03437 family)
MQNEGMKRLRLKLLTLTAVVPFMCRAEISVLQLVNPPAKQGLPEPGSLATIYCTGLVGIEGTIEASGTPLPTSLAGVRVTFGAVEAPLLAVAAFGTPPSSYQQVNFQVPFGATGPPMLVQGQQSASIPLTPAPWGQLFLNNGDLLAQHASDYRLVSSADPPRAGEWIITYGSNFGPVVQAPTSGFPAPLDRLVPLDSGGLKPWIFRVRLDTLTSSEIPLEVGFLGLAPGKVGIYQINFRMPDPLPPGPAWIYLQRIANCGFRFSAGCGIGILTDFTDWVVLYH